MSCRFEFEGTEYEVGPRGYYCTTLILPDHTVLKVIGWSQTEPPKPLQFQKLAAQPLGQTIEETSELLHGFVVWEVT